MATRFKPITKQEKDDFTARYQAFQDDNHLTAIFGPKVAEHRTKPTKFREPFRTLSLSFDPSRNDLQGKAGLRLVIRDFNQITMPAFVGGANRYRIYLGMRDDAAKSRIDILSLAFFDSIKDILTDVGFFFEITPNDQITYDGIVTSAEGWDAMRTRALDMSDNAGGYSWHCEPHCPE